MIHSSGKRGRYKRYLSMLIAFIMVCSVFLPAFAENAGGKADGEASGKAVAVTTYEFYADGSLHDRQTVKDGETLKEPSEPKKDGSTFKGWYTEKDGGSKFTDFSRQTVTEDKTVKLYAGWQEKEEPEEAKQPDEKSDETKETDIEETETVESEEQGKADDQNSGDIGEDTEETVPDENDSSEKEDVVNEEETDAETSVEDSEEADETENVSEADQDETEDTDKTDAVSSDQQEEDSETDETEVTEPSESSDVKKEDAAADDTEKSEDESDTEKNDTENVADKKEDTADTADIADPADGTAQKEENIANVQPQPSLNVGISPLDISGSKTVAVGDTITLTGSNSFLYHSWRAESLGGNVSLTNQNSQTVTVRGVEAGWVKLTHTYYTMFGGDQTEQVTIQVTEASSSQCYDLYMYTLIPGKTLNSTGTPDQTWNGMGVGTISNVLPPSSYNNSEIIDPGDGSTGAVIVDTDKNNRPYPDIRVVEGGVEKIYQYAETEEEKMKEGYYTIDWIRVIVASGANAGNNQWNPTVSDKTPTFHLDGIVTLNEENVYTVNFALKDAGEEWFIPDEHFATRVNAGYKASDLKRPDKDKALDTSGKPIEGYPYSENKVVNGITYTFDGWYTDETCTTKVDFNDENYKINENTTFYARYIPETQDITVEKQVIGTTQEDATREFTFNCEYTDASGESQTTTLNLSDDETGTIANVPVGAELTLTETNASGYDTSAEYSGETIEATETTGDTRTMTVQTTNDNRTIVVTNRKQAPTIGEDENFIIVEKKFTGITEEQIPDNFQITVSGSGQNYTLTKSNYNWSETINDDGSIVWRWKISGVGTGQYTVSEDNQEIADYTVTTTGIGDNVTVKASDVTINEEEYENTCSKTEWPVGVEGNKNFLFAAALTGSSGCIVISSEPLSASVRAAVTAKVTTYGSWHEPVQFYSVSEDGQEYSIDGKIFRYDEANGQIIIGQTSDWKHVASLSYDVTEASNPEIAITNSYEKNTSSIEVKKLVTGNLSDYDKKFAFTASWLSSDGTQKTENFSLSHNDSKTLNDLPVGTQVTISENRDDYDLVSIKQGSAELSDSEITSDGTNSSCTVTVTNEPMTITFTNEKEAIVDVGIRMDNLPYILMLALVAGGAAAAVILCRRRG